MKILKEVWLDDQDVSPNQKLEIRASENLKKRTYDFAKVYQNIVLETIKGCQS